MYGPYNSLAALNEALAKGTDHLYVGQLFDHQDWKPVDNIEVSKHYQFSDALTFRYTPALDALYKAVLTNPEFSPDVYVRVYPSAKTAENLLPPFKKALDKLNLIPQIVHVTKYGFLPAYLRVYLVSGFTPADIGRLVNAAFEHYEKYQNAKNSQEAIQRELIADAKALWSRRKRVISWSEYRFRTTAYPGGHSFTKFEFEAQGHGYPVDFGHKEYRSPFTEKELRTLAQTHTRASQGKATKLLSKQYSHYNQTLFEAFTKQLLDSITKALDDVGSLYDQAVGREVKPAEHPKPAAETPRKDGEVDLQRAHTAIGSARMKVTPSIQSTDYSFDVVSADPDHRGWMKADGTFAKPVKASVDQRDRAFVPAGPVTPLIETNAYKVIFGLHFDNPFLARDLNDQVYWYSNKNHFFYAAKRYGVLTGDRPNVVYIIYNKMGTRVNMPIAEKDLRKIGGHEVTKLLSEKRDLIESFWHNAEKGQQYFPAAISKWLGVPAEKYYTPNNPFRDKPEDIDPEAWRAYVSHVRNQLKIGLGLNFKASLSAGEQQMAAELKHHRHQIQPRFTNRRVKQFTGERDEHGKPIEPWGVYLIEYLVGYGQGEVGGAVPAYGIPVNIIRGDTRPEDSIPPHGTLHKVTKEQLEGLLRKYWPESMFANPLNRKGKATANLYGWEYIPGDPRRSFPYARLFRPIVLDNKELLNNLNQQLPKNVRKTAHGFMIDGTEFLAYVMVVAMPPSVVEKEFNWLYRNGTSRQIITDPGLLSRLALKQRQETGKTVRELGITPRPIAMRLLTTDPYAKEKQTGVNPFERLGMAATGTATPLETEYWMSELGERWRPVVSALLKDAGNSAYQAIHEYEHLNNDEARAAMLKRWHEQIKLHEQQTEHHLFRYLQAIVDRKSAEGHTTSYDVSRRLQLYMDYIKRPLDTVGQTVRVPELGYRVALMDYTAPISSVNYKTGLLTVKAPSEDIAKLVILYRLLRRSVRNPELGKTMAYKSSYSGIRPFPEANALMLAQWAKANYIVVPFQGPRARMQAPRKVLTAKDYVVQRAQKWGDHRFIHMLGFK